MGRTPGRLVRAKCAVCGDVELVSGCNAPFRCSRCRPRLSPYQAAQNAAHLAVARARRTGILAPASRYSCADCAGPAIEYDHRDYGKPLEVAPVCRRCNLRRGPALFTELVAA